MADDEITPEDGSAAFAHVFGARSPVPIAHVFTQALARGDIEDAWRFADEPLRREAARRWVWTYRDHPGVRSFDRDAAAAALTRPDADHPLWNDFAASQIASFGETLPWLSVGHLAALGTPRPLGPDLEVVVLADDRNSGWYAPDIRREVATLQLIMHMTASGWLVAGVGERTATGHWPNEG